MVSLSRIEGIRAAIDDIDSQLVAIIAQRGKCVKAAAAFKKIRRLCVLLIGSDGHR